MANSVQELPRQQSRQQSLSLFDEEVRKGVERLEGKGWKRIGVNDRGETTWQDPEMLAATTAFNEVDGKGRLKRAFRELELPTEGGGHETIRQLVLPPLEIPYTLGAALQLEHDREVGLATQKAEALRVKEWKEEQARLLAEKKAQRAVMLEKAAASRI